MSMQDRAGYEAAKAELLGKLKEPPARPGPTPSDLQVQPSLGDVRVLGPEHDECVFAYNLLRQELKKRTAERDAAQRIAREAVALCADLLRRYRRNHPGVPMVRTESMSEDRHAELGRRVLAWQNQLDQDGSNPDGGAA